MSGPNEFNNLKCKCNGEEFQQIVNIVWKEGGGVVMKPIGYNCVKCHSRVSTEAAISRARKRHIEAQLEELNTQQKNNDDQIKQSEKRAAELSNKVA